MREGGIRVPLIIRGPGIKPDSWSHQAVVGFDFYNTFAELAGIRTALPDGVEGGSMVHFFRGEERPVTRAREGLVFHFPHYQNDAAHSAIIKGDYKLLHFYETGTFKLYNLNDDLGERRDLSSTEAGRADQLNKELIARLAALEAAVPELNPLYDPKHAPKIKKGSGGGRSNRR